ncbi:hypothetical protein HZA87_03965, partial [Candidatus Uhrbacteria bacterium]|nr:hypothetical protein [Candidatus Uhrbacteria bacterium]
MNASMIQWLAKDFAASDVRTSNISLVLISLFLALGGFFLLPGSAEAAAKNGFEALPVSMPKAGFTVVPGEETQVLMTFKNIGTKTWKNSGSSYVSIYTYDPKYRVSDFRGSDWVDYTQAALLKESSVAVGGLGSIYLTLKAPKSEGTYEETFQLAAEDMAWIPGGEFTLTIKVDDGVDDESTDPGLSLGEAEEVSLADGEASPESNGLSATVLLRSAKSVSAKAGEKITYKVGVKNTGTVTWKIREVVTSDFTIATSHKDDTAHASWVSSTQLVVNDTGSVKPGGVDFFTFAFTA